MAKARARKTGALKQQATKADIQMLMKRVWGLYDAHAKWKEEMLDRQEQWKDDIVRKSAEMIGKELAAAKRDEVETLKDARQNHERRIIALERVAGLKGE
jgi:hypothetical protein